MTKRFLFGVAIGALGAFLWWAHDGLWFLFNIAMRALP